MLVRLRHCGPHRQKVRTPQQARLPAEVRHQNRALLALLLLLLLAAPLPPSWRYPVRAAAGALPCAWVQATLKAVVVARWRVGCPCLRAMREGLCACFLLQRRSALAEARQQLASLLLSALHCCPAGCVRSWRRC